MAFIKNTSLVDVTPKFAIVKGQRINKMDSLLASNKFMKSHFAKHVQYL